LGYTMTIEELARQLWYKEALKEICIITWHEIPVRLQQYYIEEALTNQLMLNSPTKLIRPSSTV
jgi:hypothetical protein